MKENNNLKMDATFLDSYTSFMWYSQNNSRQKFDDKSIGDVEYVVNLLNTADAITQDQLDFVRNLASNLRNIKTQNFNMDELTAQQQRVLDRLTAIDSTINEIQGITREESYDKTTFKELENNTNLISRMLNSNMGRAESAYNAYFLSLQNKNSNPNNPQLEESMKVLEKSFDAYNGFASTIGKEIEEIGWKSRYGIGNEKIVEKFQKYAEQYQVLSKGVDEKISQYGIKYKDNPSYLKDKDSGKLKSVPYSNKSFKVKGNKSSKTWLEETGTYANIEYLKNNLLSTKKLSHNKFEYNDEYELIQGNLSDNQFSDMVEFQNSLNEFTSLLSNQMFESDSLDSLFDIFTTLNKGFGFKSQQGSLANVMDDIVKIYKDDLSMIKTQYQKEDKNGNKRWVSAVNQESELLLDFINNELYPYLQEDMVKSKGRIDASFVEKQQRDIARVNKKKASLGRTITSKAQVTSQGRGNKDVNAVGNLLLEETKAINDILGTKIAIEESNQKSTKNIKFVEPKAELISKGTVKQIEDITTNIGKLTYSEARVDNVMHQNNIERGWASKIGGIAEQLINEFRKTPNIKSQDDLKQYATMVNDDLGMAFSDLISIDVEDNGEDIVTYGRAYFDKTSNELKKFNSLISYSDETKFKDVYSKEFQKGINDKTFTKFSAAFGKSIGLKNDYIAKIQNQTLGDDEIAEIVQNLYDAQQGVIKSYSQYFDNLSSIPDFIDVKGIQDEIAQFKGSIGQNAKTDIGKLRKLAAVEKTTLRDDVENVLNNLSDTYLNPTLEGRDNPLDKFPVKGARTVGSKIRRNYGNKAADEFEQFEHISDEDAYYTMLASIAQNFNKGKPMALIQQLAAMAMETDNTINKDAAFSWAQKTSNFILDRVLEGKDTNSIIDQLKYSYSQKNQLKSNLISKKGSYASNLESLMQMIPKSISDSNRAWFKSVGVDSSILSSMDQNAIIRGIIDDATEAGEIVSSHIGKDQSGKNIIDLYLLDEKAQEAYKDQLENYETLFEASGIEGSGVTRVRSNFIDENGLIDSDNLNSFDELRYNLTSGGLAPLTTINLQKIQRKINKNRNADLKDKLTNAELSRSLEFLGTKAGREEPRTYRGFDRYDEANKRLSPFSHVTAREMASKMISTNLRDVTYDFLSRNQDAIEKIRLDIDQSKGKKSSIYANWKAIQPEDISEDDTAMMVTLLNQMATMSPDMSLEDVLTSENSMFAQLYGDLGAGFARDKRIMSDLGRIKNDVAKGLFFSLEGKSVGSSAKGHGQFASMASLSNSQYGLQGGVRADETIRKNLVEIASMAKVNNDVNSLMNGPNKWMTPVLGRGIKGPSFADQGVTAEELEGYFLSVESSEMNKWANEFLTGLYNKGFKTRGIGDNYYTYGRAQDLINTLKIGELSEDSAMIFESVLKDIVPYANTKHSDIIVWDDIKNQTQFLSKFNLNPEDLTKYNSDEYYDQDIKILNDLGNGISESFKIGENDIVGIGEQMSLEIGDILKSISVYKEGIRFNADSGLPVSNGLKIAVGQGRKSIENFFHHIGNLMNLDTFDSLNGEEIQSQFEKYVKGRYEESMFDDGTGRNLNAKQIEKRFDKYVNGQGEGFLDKLGIMGIIASDQSKIYDFRKDTDYFFGRKEALMQRMIKGNDGKIDTQKYDQFKQRMANFIETESSREGAASKESLQNIANYLFSETDRELTQTKEGTILGPNGKPILGETPEQLAEIYALTNDPNFWNRMGQEVIPEEDKYFKKLWLSEALRAETINAKRETVPIGGFGNAPILGTKNKYSKQGGMRTSFDLRRNREEFNKLSSEKLTESYAKEYGVSNKEAQQIVNKFNEGVMSRYDINGKESQSVIARMNTLNDAFLDLFSRPSDRFNNYNADYDNKNVVTLGFGGGDIDLSKGNGISTSRGVEYLSEEDAKNYWAYQAKEKAMQLAEAHGVDVSQIKFKLDLSSLGTSKQSKLGPLQYTNGLYLPFVHDGSELLKTYRGKGLGQQYKISSFDRSNTSFIEAILGAASGASEESNFTFEQLQNIYDPLISSVQKGSALHEIGIKSMIPGTISGKVGSGKDDLYAGISSNAFYESRIWGGDSNDRTGQASLILNNLRLYKYLENKRTGKNLVDDIESLDITSDYLNKLIDSYELGKYIDSEADDGSLQELANVFGKDIDKYGQEIANSLTEYVTAGNRLLPTTIIRQPINLSEQTGKVFARVSDTLGDYAIYTAKSWNLIQKADQDGDTAAADIGDTIRYTWEKYSDFANGYNAAFNEAEVNTEILKDIAAIQSYKAVNKDFGWEQYFEKNKGKTVQLEKEIETESGEKILKKAELKIPKSKSSDSYWATRRQYIDTNSQPSKEYASSLGKWAAFAANMNAQNAVTYASRLNNRAVGKNTYQLEDVSYMLQQYIDQGINSISDIPEIKNLTGTELTAFEHIVKPALNEALKESPIGAKKLINQVFGSENIVGDLVKIDPNKMVDLFQQAQISSIFQRTSEASEGNKVLASLLSLQKYSPEAYQSLINAGYINEKEVEVDGKKLNKPFSINPEKSGMLFSSMMAEANKFEMKNKGAFESHKERESRDNGLIHNRVSASVTEQSLTNEYVKNLEAAKAEQKGVESLDSTLNKSISIEKTKSATSKDLQANMSKEIDLNTEADGREITSTFILEGTDKAIEDINSFQDRLNQLSKSNRVDFNTGESLSDAQVYSYDQMNFKENGHVYSLQDNPNIKFASATGIEGRITHGKPTAFAEQIELNEYIESKKNDALIKKESLNSESYEAMRDYLISTHGGKDEYSKWAKKAVSADRGTYEHIFKDVFAKSGLTIADLFSQYKDTGSSFAEYMMNSILNAKSTNEFSSLGTIFNAEGANFNLKDLKSNPFSTESAQSIIEARDKLIHFGDRDWESYSEIFKTNADNYLKELQAQKIEFTNASEIYGGYSFNNPLKGNEKVYIAGMGDQIVFNEGTKQFEYFDNKGYNSKYGHGFQYLFQKRLFMDKNSGYQDALINSWNGNRTYGFDTKEQWAEKVKSEVESGRLVGRLAESTDYGFDLAKIITGTEEWTKSQIDGILQTYWTIAEQNGISGELANKLLGFGVMSQKTPTRRSYKQLQLFSGNDNDGITALKKYGQAYEKYKKYISITGEEDSDGALKKWFLEDNYNAEKTGIFGKYKLFETNPEESTDGQQPDKTVMGELFFDKISEIDNKFKINETKIKNEEKDIADYFKLLRQEDKLNKRISEQKDTKNPGWRLESELFLAKKSKESQEELLQKRYGNDYKNNQFYTEQNKAYNSWKETLDKYPVQPEDESDNINSNVLESDKGKASIAISEYRTSQQSLIAFQNYWGKLDNFYKKNSEKIKDLRHVIDNDKIPEENKTEERKSFNALMNERDGLIHDIGLMYNRITGSTQEDMVKFRSSLQHDENNKDDYGFMYQDYKKGYDTQLNEIIESKRNEALKYSSDDKLNQIKADANLRLDYIPEITEADKDIGELKKKLTPSIEKYAKAFYNMTLAADDYGWYENESNLLDQQIEEAKINGEDTSRLINKKNAIQTSMMKAQERHNAAYYEAMSHENEAAIFRSMYGNEYKGIFQQYFGDDAGKIRVKETMENGEITESIGLLESTFDQFAKNFASILSQYIIKDGRQVENDEFFSQWRRREYAAEISGKSAYGLKTGEMRSRKSVASENQKLAHASMDSVYSFGSNVSKLKSIQTQIKAIEDYKKSNNLSELSDSLKNKYDELKEKEKLLNGVLYGQYEDAEGNAYIDPNRGWNKEKGTFNGRILTANQAAAMTFFEENVKSKPTYASNEDVQGYLQEKIMQARFRVMRNEMENAEAETTTQEPESAKPEESKIEESQQTVPAEEVKTEETQQVVSTEEPKSAETQVGEQMVAQAEGMKTGVIGVAKEIKDGLLNNEPKGKEKVENGEKGEKGEKGEEKPEETKPVIEQPKEEPKPKPVVIQPIEESKTEPLKEESKEEVKEPSVKPIEPPKTEPPKTEPPVVIPAEPPKTEETKGEDKKDQTQKPEVETLAAGEKDSSYIFGTNTQGQSNINGGIISDDTAKNLKEATDALSEAKTQEDIDKIEQDLNSPPQPQAPKENFITESLNYRINQFLTYGIASKIFGTISQSFKKVVSSAQELNAAMVNIRIATGKAAEETSDLMKQYSSLATSIGRTTTEVANAANDWLRAGYDGAEANDLITASMYLSTLGMMESEEATESLISILKGWKLSSEEVMNVVDKLVTVDMSAAVSAGDIATAMAKVNYSAQSAGIEMDTLIGILTTGQEVSQQAPEQVGNAWRTIISRIQNVKAGKYSANYEDMASSDYDESDYEALNDVETVLKSLGINLRDGALSWRNTEDVLNEIGSKWNTFDDISKSAIANAMAGTRQREQFILSMENWDSIQEYSELASNAYGTAAEKMTVYTDSVAAAKNKLTAAFENFSLTFSDMNFLSGLYNLGASLLNNIGASVMGLIGLIIINWKGIVGTLKSPLRTLITKFAELGTQTTNLINKFGMMSGTKQKPGKIDDATRAGALGNAAVLGGSVIGMTAGSLVGKEIGGETGQAYGSMVGMLGGQLLGKAVKSGIEKSAAAKVAGSAATGLGAGPWAAIIMLIISGLSAAAVAIKNKIVKEAAEDYEEKQSKATETANVANKIDEYEKLAKGVDKFGNNLSLTDEEYSEFLSIGNEIHSVLPELTAQYDELGNAIFVTAAKTGQLNEKLEEQNEIAEHESNEALLENNLLGTNLRDSKRNHKDIDLDLKKDSDGIIGWKLDYSDANAKEYLENNGVEFIGETDYIVETDENMERAKEIIAQYNENNKKYITEEMIDEIKAVYGEVGYDSELYAKKIENIEDDDELNGLMSTLLYNIDVSDYGSDDFENEVSKIIKGYIDVLSNEDFIDLKTKFSLEYDDANTMSEIGLAREDFKNGLLEIFGKDGEIDSSEQAILLSYGFQYDSDTGDTYDLEDSVYRFKNAFGLTDQKWNRINANTKYRLGNYLEGMTEDDSNRLFDYIEDGYISENMSVETIQNIMNGFRERNDIYGKNTQLEEYNNLMGSYENSWYNSRRSIYENAANGTEYSSDQISKMTGETGEDLDRIMGWIKALNSGEKTVDEAMEDVNLTSYKGNNLYDSLKFMFGQSKNGTEYDLSDIAQKMAQYQLSESMINTIQYLTEQLNEGTITSEEAIDQFNDAFEREVDNLRTDIAGLVIEDLFPEVEIEGAIDSFSELKDVVDALASSYEKLADAQEEQDIYGKVSLDTVLELAEENPDYLDAFNYSNGEFTLKTNANDIVNGVRKQAIYDSYATTFEKDTEELAQLQNEINQLNGDATGDHGTSYYLTDLNGEETGEIVAVSNKQEVLNEKQDEYNELLSKTAGEANLLDSLQYYGESTLDTQVRLNDEYERTSELLSQMDYGEAGYEELKNNLDDVYSKLERINAQLGVEKWFGDVSGIDGIINTYDELYNVLESIDQMYEDLDDAKKEENATGKVSMQTAMKLITTDSNYAEVLYEENGQLHLVDNAEQILGESKIEAARKSAIAAVAANNEQVELLRLEYQNLLTGESSETVANTSLGQAKAYDELAKAAANAAFYSTLFNTAQGDITFNFTEFEKYTKNKGSYVANTGSNINESVFTESTQKDELYVKQRIAEIKELAGVTEEVKVKKAGGDAGATKYDNYDIIDGKVQGIKEEDLDNLYETVTTTVIGKEVYDANTGMFYYSGGSIGENSWVNLQAVSLYDQMKEGDYDKDVWDDLYDAWDGSDLKDLIDKLKDALASLNKEYSQWLALNKKNAGQITDTLSEMDDTYYADQLKILKELIKLEETYLENRGIKSYEDIIKIKDDDERSKAFEVYEDLMTHKLQVENQDDERYDDAIEMYSQQDAITDELVEQYRLKYYQASDTDPEILQYAKDYYDILLQQIEAEYDYQSALLESLEIQKEQAKYSPLDSEYDSYYSSKTSITQEMIKIKKKEANEYLWSQGQQLVKSGQYEDIESAEEYVKATDEYQSKLNEIANLENDLKNIDDERIQGKIDYLELLGKNNKDLITQYKELVKVADSEEERLEYQLKLNDAIKEQNKLIKEELDFRKEINDHQLEYESGNPYDNEEYDNLMSSNKNILKDQLKNAKDQAKEYHQMAYDNWIDAGYSEEVANEKANYDADYQAAITEYMTAYKALGDLAIQELTDKCDALQRQIDYINNTKPDEWLIEWDDKDNVVENAFDKIKEYYDSLIEQTDKIVQECEEMLEDVEYMTDEQIESIVDKANEAIKQIHEYELSKLNDIKSKQEELYSDVTSYVQDEIDQLNNRKEIISDMYDEEISKLQDKEKSIERTNKLIELQNNLLNAQKEKKRVYREGIGWTYETDRSAVKTAQQELDAFYRQDSIDDLTAAKEAELKELDERISNWSDYLEMLETKYKEYETLQRNKRLMEEFDLESMEELHQFVIDDMTTFTEQMANQQSALLENQQSVYTNYMSNLNGFFSEYKETLEAIREESSKELNLITPSELEKYLEDSYADVEDVVSEAEKSTGNGTTSKQNLNNEKEYNYIKEEDWEWINKIEDEEKKLEAMEKMNEAGKNWSTTNNTHSDAQETRLEYGGVISTNANGTGVRSVTLSDDDKKVSSKLSGEEKTNYETTIAEASAKWTQADEDYKNGKLSYAEAKAIKDAAHEEASEARQAQGYKDDASGKIISGFASGINQGPVTYTGLAMLHGSTSSPEYVLTNDQAYNLLRYMATAKPEFESCYGDNGGTQYIVQGDVVLNEVDNAADFWNEVTKTMSNRYNVTKNKK